MSADANLVKQMLEQDLHNAQHLQALLSTERELLKAHDHDNLHTLIMDKTQRVELLDGHARERSALLKSLGLSPDSDGWLHLLQTTPALTELVPLWQDIQASVDSCKRLNEVNARLVARSQQTLHRLLDLIRGKSALPSLYNASGNATNASSSSTVAKA